MRACVHACVPLTCAKSIYMCAQVRISRMRTRSARWETPQFTMIKIPPTGQPVTNPLSPLVAFATGVLYILYISLLLPAPLSRVVAESRLCTESFLIIIRSDGSRNSRGSNKIILLETVHRTHLFERTHTVENSRSFRFTQPCCFHAVTNCLENAKWSQKEA